MKNFFQSSLIKNASYLSIMQASNYIIPLLTIPYLLRVLGIENYAKVLLAQTLVMILSTLTDYGYTITGIRDIALHKNNKKELSYYYSKVTNVKIFLVITSIIVAFLFSILYQKLNSELLLVLLSLTFLISHTFTPSWYFIAIGKISQLTIISFISKAIYIIMVFSFISSPEHYIYVNLFMGIGGFVGVLISIYIINIKDQITYYFTSFKIASIELKENFSLFFSNISSIIYQNSSLLVLGMHGSQTHIGNYGSVEKIINAEKQLINVYINLIFPKISFLTSISHREIVIFLKRTFSYFYPAMVSVCLVNVLLSSKIIWAAAGNNANNEMVSLLKIMSFLPLLVSLGTPFHQNLLAYNKKKDVSILLIFSSIVGFALILFLSKIYLAKGTVIAIYITECLIILGFIYLNEFKFRELSLKQEQKKQ